MEVLYKNQIDFIAYLQRLLQEGDFAATYKFAFLHAIADICIEKRIPKNSKLQISFDEIVEKLITIYWQHAKPFSADNNVVLEKGVLKQNTGNQAKIISDIILLLEDGASNITQAKLSRYWKQTYQNTMRTFKEGPLWRLQILSKSEHCFLFPHVKDRNYIELNPGIADCFQQFHDLVVQFARQGWIDKISKIRQNQAIIGKAGELSDFLFNSSRNSLKPASSVLQDIQKNLCFYCKKSLNDNSEVDHFIPFSKYNNDLAHNFVLAHKTCNNNKRSYLAAPEHRDSWIEQNLDVHKGLITQELGSYFNCDPTRTLRIAEWAYDVATTNGSKFWLANRDVFV